MPIERYKSPATITTVPRSTLMHAHQKEIDAILKDLKHCSRHLKAALDGFKDELRTLERLYYKCKNQHRMALFFKRVPEIRRYGRRLSELDILGHVDLLRASFVGAEHMNDHKALRNSWSHVPEKAYIYFLTERLTACSTLVCKMQERLEKAYQHFVLAMQTGSFVQFIILFIAISSRMSVLSSQLEEAAQLSISTCNRLLVIIHLIGTHKTSSQRLPSEPEISCPSQVHHDVPLDDTGQPISRGEPSNNSVSVIEDLSMKTEATLWVRVTPQPDQPTNGIDNGISGDQTPVQASKRVTVKVAQKPLSTRAKKKFDEIDEIFGF